MATSMTGSRGRGGINGDVIPKGYEKGRLQQYTPGQMAEFQRSFGRVGPESYTSRLAGGDQSMFEEMEAPAMRQFSGLQGGLASRFSGAGSGARHSSGFQNESSAAAGNFAQQLQAQRQGLQRQAIMDLHGMSQDLLGNKPYENFLMEKPQRQGFDWGGAVGGALGGLAGFATGGPMGAMSGASMGYGIGSGKGSNAQFQSTPGWGQQRPTQSYGSQYDQAFRMNPSLMGY